ncbi:hypothetical protein OVA30_21060 [Methylorubrum sp. SL192]|nr:hypothetical protein [Methylorubrum sp. SL192]
MGSHRARADLLLSREELGCLAGAVVEVEPAEDPGCNAISTAGRLDDHGRHGVDDVLRALGDDRHRDGDRKRLSFSRTVQCFAAEADSLLEPHLDPTLRLEQGRPRVDLADGPGDRGRDDRQEDRQDWIAQRHGRRVEPVAPGQDESLIGDGGDLGGESGRCNPGKRPRREHKHADHGGDPDGGMRGGPGRLGIEKFASGAEKSLSAEQMQGMEPDRRVDLV